MDIKAQEPHQHHIKQEGMNNKVKSTNTQIQPQKGLKSSFTYA
jgi:hypothetical protein